MKVTTSRGPSVKSRRLGRALAAFLCIPYENRGRQSLTEEAWMIVVENHGNPHGLVKRFEGREERLTFELSSEPRRRHFKRLPVSVTGVQEMALPIARFFDLCWSGNREQQRAVVVASGQIDFVDEGEVVFRLKI